MAKSVNDILAQMRKSGKMQDWKGKGTFGEDAVLAVVHDYYLRHGGLLYHSFSYPYASDKNNRVYLGNIFLKEDGTYTHISKQVTDEIDILYISPNRIFPIEVKSYHAKMEVSVQHLKKNGSVQYEGMGHKHPLWQAEKHARHLYHQIYDVLPDGNPHYIRPIVCFADRCTVRDIRSDNSKCYLPVTILNELKGLIKDLDLPLQYGLNLPAIEKKLREIRR